MKKKFVSGCQTGTTGVRGSAYPGSEIVGDPGEEGDLVPRGASAGWSKSGRIWAIGIPHTLAVGASSRVVLDIVDGVPCAGALLASLVLGLGVEQELAELVPLRLLGLVRLLLLVLDDDLLAVVRDLVDDPLKVLAQLELVEDADAVRRDGNTRRGERMLAAGKAVGGRRVGSAICHQGCGCVDSAGGTRGRRKRGARAAAIASDGREARERGVEGEG